MNRKVCVLSILLIVFFGMLVFVTFQVRGDYDPNIAEVWLTIPEDAVIHTDHVLEGNAYLVKGRENTFQVDVEMALYQHTGVFFWREGSIVFVEYINGDGVEAEIKWLKKDEENGKYRIKVEFRTPHVKDGETVKVHIQQEPFEAKGTALPVSALGRDEQGYYIYEVHREREAWGYIYTLKKVGVTVIVGDENHFAVYGYKFHYPLVKQLSSKLFDGGRVYISKRQAVEMGKTSRTNRLPPEVTTIDLQNRTQTIQNK